MKLFSTLLIFTTTSLCLSQNPVIFSNDFQDFLIQKQVSHYEILGPHEADHLYNDIVERTYHKMNVYPFRHTLKLSAGWSLQQLYAHQALTHPYHEDLYTTSNYWEQLHISASHEIYLSQIFSFCYTAGIGQNNTWVNANRLSSFNASFFINPKLSYFRSRNVEGYVKLNIGGVYNNTDFGLIESEFLHRQLPPNFKLYTGFTPIGLNFRLTDNWWLNSELSLWSFETLSIGIKYKFGKNIYRENMYFESNSSN